MDSKLLNDIAALESGNLSPDEREEVLMRLAVDPMGGLLLRPLGGSLAPAEPLGPAGEMPFPVTQKVRLGVCDGYLRLFDLKGLQLQRNIQRGLALLKGIGGELMPLCLKRELSLDFSLTPIKGSVRIVVPDEGGKVDLLVQIEEPIRRRDYIEFWEGGILLVAHKADKQSVSVPIQGSTPLAIRHTSCPFGIGIRIAPVLFEERDWLAACIFSAMEGGFVDAAALLPRLTREGLCIPDCLTRIRSCLEVIRGLTKVEGYMLTPMPAVRGQQIPETTPLVYGGLWGVIVACWPECQQLTDKEEVIEVNFSPEVLQFARAVQNGMSGRPPGIPSAVQTENSTLREGWKVLEGLQHLASGRPREALNVFDSFQPSPEDPFGASGMRFLAKHLFFCQQAGRSSVDLESMSQEVWKQVFQPLLPAPPGRES